MVGAERVALRTPSVQQTALEFGAEVGREHRPRAVDQQGHLVADQADVALCDTPGVLSTKLVINQFRFCAAWLIGLN